MGRKKNGTALLISLHENLFICVNILSCVLIFIQTNASNLKVKLINKCASFILLKQNLLRLLTNIQFR